MDSAPSEWDQNRSTYWKNAKVIIPFVLVAWLGLLFLLQPGTPTLLVAAFIVAIAVAIPVMVFYGVRSPDASEPARSTQDPGRRARLARWHT